MLKRFISIFMALLMIMVLAPSGVHAEGAAASDLTAPQGLAVSCEGTNLVLTWQNPASVANLAKSSYISYKGTVNYIIDWRANKGEWHYSGEIPSGKDILDCFENIPAQFCGTVYGSKSDIAVKSVINKTLMGVPYTVEVQKWLKTNNLEFRIRYVYGYWDESRGETANQNSAFSSSVLIGIANPDNTMDNTAPAVSGGVPEAPSSIEAPRGLVSEYMTLGLRWQVPESIKTLNDQQLYTVYAIIDWKLNGGKWNDGLKTFRGKGNMSLVKDSSDLIMDKDGYIHMHLDRSALGIPDNVSLRVWLAGRTYSFRVRYVLQSPGMNKVMEVLSPYSNTVMLGRGTAAPTAPILAAPSGFKAAVTTEYGRKKVTFKWIVPSSVTQVNKKLWVTALLDYKVKGGKWLTEKGGKEEAEGTTGDLRDNCYKTLEAGKTQGVISYRIFFASEYQPDKYTYSGFSNIITVDIKSGKIISSNNK